MISQRLPISEKLIGPVEFDVEASRAWQAFKSDLGYAWDDNVFQSGRWVSNWYEAFSRRPDFEPLLLTVRNVQTRLVALRLPLVKYKVNGVRIVEFADLGVNIYNRPILGPAAPRDPDGAAEMWRDVRAALQREGVDFIRLGKMPVDLDGRPNPLALLQDARPSALNGNLVDTADDLEAYRFSIRKMQLARSWRVFARHPDPAFRVIREPQEALRILATMDEQQTKVYERAGKIFVMDEPRLALYRNLVASGVGDGSVVMTALTSGTELVAAALGLRHGSYYIVLRISHAGEQWSNCSPGRLIMDQTIAALHRDGVRRFDFGPGNDELKRRFGAVGMPLAELTEPLTLRGFVMSRASKWVRDNPRIKAFVHRLMRRIGIRAFMQV
jgi:CelD/BcsL family acetyltransferase involved in cellulose biosynthesis